MILTNFIPYLAWITFWCIWGMTQRAISIKKRYHYHMFWKLSNLRILNFRQNHLIFQKSGISAKKMVLFSIFFFVSTLLLYSEFNGIDRFPQKCIILFCWIPGYFDHKEPHYKIKCKYGNNYKKCDTFGITYQVWDCFLKYTNV